MGNNVILIGMPGAGKSTLGVVLAKTLGFRFLDSDLLIQEREGALLCEIIEQKGLDGFLSIEEEVNASIEAENTVIATGGSAVYGARAMEHLKGIGTVIYIRLSLQEIISRVGDVKHRGIALRKGQSFSQLYEQRCPLYEKYADIVIDAEGLSIEKLVKMMGNRLKGTILR
ncbi:MAG: shikimate kinase [Lachnospiraceae bacterium]|nr:shikimate kinase [Lachnospiraceae bacterium]